MKLFYGTLFLEKSTYCVITLSTTNRLRIFMGNLKVQNCTERTYAEKMNKISSNTR